MSVSVFTNNVSFSLCVGDNDNQAAQKRNARSKHNSKLDPVTVHGEADVEMLVTREENANNQSKYYQSNVWFMILLIMYLSHCGYRRFTSITRQS
jgi:hypothetical protein